MDNTVIELFAGVGGFRVGLNNIKDYDSNGKAKEEEKFKFVWANQWEPSTKVQHAFECYNYRFSNTDSENCNIDISLVNKNEIPNHTLLCGGFPCQDYSVARSLSNGKGIEGKKGVLWWQIRDILVAKKTPFVLLENVDRLAKSPASQRGRDFGIMLRCFAELGYTVEWRIINAAEYGLPQRRRRIYIFAYKNTTKYARKIKKCKVETIMYSKGIFAEKFKIQKNNLEIKSIDLMSEFVDLIDVSNKLNFRFENTGILLNGIVYTAKTIPVYEKSIVLSEILEKNVDNQFFLNDMKIEKFKYLRGRKKILRTTPDGLTYYYAEGAMSSFDDIKLPGRTMLTSESSLNRSTHIIMDPQKNKLRFLTPIECERLNQFPDNWTKYVMPEKKRYFMMGNALVCGIVSRIGEKIKEIIDNE